MYKFNKDDAFRFAREQGIRTKTVGSELRFYKCPYCKNATNDKDTFAINLDTGMFKCMRASCSAHGNMITLHKDFGLNWVCFGFVYSFLRSDFPSWTQKVLHPCNH